MNRQGVERVAELLKAGYPEPLPGISSEWTGIAARFYELLAAENQVQNLTRLETPEEFVSGHFADVWRLVESGLVDTPAMDLGSGGGVPGLLTAALTGAPWVLAEAEQRKAEFLRRAAGELGLSNVTVWAGRAEEWLKTGEVSSIVARAVGPVSRIYGWIRGCSTWNNLVLLKGPRFEEEWADFSGGKHKRELLLDKQVFYCVGSEGPEQRTRTIAKILRTKGGAKRQ